jgi:hypothetical protein
MLIQQPGDFHGRSLRRLPGSSSELTMSPSPVATVARSHLSPDGGSLPRHAYHRLAADGYDSARSHLSPVATCRQTVEAFLATPRSSSELTMSPSPVATVARSHLSPDGGSLPRHAYHRLAADGYDSARSHRRP